MPTASPLLKKKLDIKLQVDNKMLQIFVMAKNVNDIEDIEKFLKVNDLSNLHLNSNFKFKFGTDLSPNDFLTKDFETMVKKAAKIKVNVESSIKFAIISKFFMRFLNEQGEINSSAGMLLKVIVAFISFLRMIPKINSEIELHEDDVISFMKDLGEIFPEMEYEKIKGLVDGEMLPKLRAMFEKMKSMFGEQAEGFKSALEAIDFKEINAYVIIKPISFSANVIVRLKKMDNVIEKFFN